MKKLFLIRHSKSSRELELINDLDRPLTERGYRDAVSMSAVLKSELEMPDLILTSQSVRTWSTALIFARTFNYESSKIKVDTRIYEASTKELLSIINRIHEDFSNVLLFGHNPGLQKFISYLCGVDNGHFSTSAIAGVQFNNLSWDEISQSTGELFFLKEPKSNVYL
ncbi:MAG TPA: histidine phosphatase family protein [Bacteroidia bacterium]|nr:histidine phosphatase family protein [Bacteroidia bacterium]HNU34612.1 histidine phosphatase family protein [Bacteroidia bacterium]